MASAPEGQPFFEQHAIKIGMERALLDKFIAGGIKTVSQAAYAATPPGQVLTDDKVTALCNTLGENRPSLNQLTVVKRVLFEAQTMSLAHLKASIEQQPESAVRKLPGAERAQRLELQAARLGGLEIRNDLEPAFCVYDSVTTQIEQGSLKYIHPSKVPTRQQELSQAKPTKEVTLDASGNGLAIHDKPSKVQAQLGTEMATYRALQRRGLAYDLVGVLSFRVHERWLQKAFGHMSTDEVGRQRPGNRCQVSRQGHRGGQQHHGCELSFHAIVADAAAARQRRPLGKVETMGGRQGRPVGSAGEVAEDRERKDGGQVSFQGQG